MAVAVDRGSLLIDYIVRSFNPIKDALLAIGIFFTVKHVISLTYQSFQYINVKLFPRILKIDLNLHFRVGTNMYY